MGIRCDWFELGVHYTPNGFEKLTLKKKKKTTWFRQYIEEFSVYDITKPYDVDGNAANHMYMIYTGSL